jgi:hypothetical protein
VAAFSTRVAHPRSSCPLAEGGGGGGAGGGECGLMCGARVSKCFSFGRLHWWGLVAPQVRVSGLVLVPTAVCLLPWGRGRVCGHCPFCVTSLAWPPLPLWGGAACCLVALVPALRDPHPWLAFPFSLCFTVAETRIAGLPCSLCPPPTPSTPPPYCAYPCIWTPCPCGCPVCVLHSCISSPSALAKWFWGACRVVGGCAAVLPVLLAGRFSLWFPPSRSSLFFCCVPLCARLCSRLGWNRLSSPW